MQKTKFPAVFATFLVCYAFWVLLTWSFTVQELVIGAGVSVAVALFASHFFVHKDPGWLLKKGRILNGLKYWLITFPSELIKANWSMSRICYGGCTDIKPGIVKVPTDLKSDYGLAALANSITLTPGTITMEVAEDDDGREYLYVHWIDVKETEPEAAGEAIKGKLEKGLKEVWR